MAAATALPPPPPVESFGRSESAHSNVGCRSCCVYDAGMLTLSELFFFIMN